MLSKVDWYSLIDLKTFARQEKREYFTKKEVDFMVNSVGFLKVSAINSRMEPLETGSVR